MILKETVINLKEGRLPVLTSRKHSVHALEVQMCLHLNQQEFFF